MGYPKQVLLGTPGGPYISFVCFTGVPFRTPPGPATLPECVENVELCSSLPCSGGRLGIWGKPPTELYGPPGVPKSNCFGYPKTTPKKVAPGRPLPTPSRPNDYFFFRVRGRGVSGGGSANSLFRQFFITFPPRVLWAPRGVAETRFLMVWDLFGLILGCFCHDFWATFL